MEITALIVGAMMVVIVVLLFYINKVNREELNRSLLRFEERLEKSLNMLNELQKERLEQISSRQIEQIATLEKNQIEKLSQLEKGQSERLGQMEKSQTEKLEQLGKSQSERLEQLEKSQTERLAQNEKSQTEKLALIEKMQREKLEQLDKTQNNILDKTGEKLESIRVTVEEKLDKTLSERLGQSFETVGKQLNEVQQGLGEMKSLAQDVGGLKKVLSNVKMRGGLGEVQLQMLLESILAPEQYGTNVSVKPGAREVVEFAVKLPGNGADTIWLPIDAKFPKDVYEKLQDAYDLGESSAIEVAHKELDAAIKLNAKDISSKYIEPPYTTNFAIMFLPFEGIYAEVVRKAGLLDELQRKYNVIVTGPTTFAAILNSLQMGFRTLAIQKRSNEVWETLGAVKTEFDKFGGILDKARTKIQGGLTDMDALMGVRTRAIQRTLRSVETLEPHKAEKLLEE